MTHAVSISANETKCSCRQWIAPPSLQPGETMGVFTVRAYEAHREHVARWKAPAPAQRSMFVDSVPTPQPEPDQPSLF